MELVERIDLAKAQYLHSFTFKDFQTYITGKKSVDEQKKLYDKIKHYCETIIKTRGETKRIYSYSLTTPLEVGGRLFCGNSIQGIPKNFRGFLMEQHTTDIDMKNAHPTILEWLCKKNGILCPNLAYYNSNRDDILNVFDDRDTAKEIFLKSVNDDKLNKKEKNGFFKDFDKEMKYIQKELLDLPEYEYVKLSVPEHKAYNFYGSAINRLLCKYENNILQSVISVINKHNIEISALMFDGLMVYGNYYNDTQLLDDIEKYVEQNFEGLNMKFSYKQHSTNIQLPRDYQKDTQIQKNMDDDIEYLIHNETCYDIANYFCKKWGHQLKCIDVRLRNFYYFSDDKKIWELYEAGVIVREIISNQMVSDFEKYRNVVVCDETKMKKLANIIFKLKNTNDKNNILREICDKLYDPNFANTFNRQEFELPLKNGMKLNLKTLDITERTILDKFNFECNASYVDMTEIQENDIKQYFMDLFCNKEDTVQCVLNIIKSMFIGRPLRHIFFWTGTGRNGKSLLLKLLCNIFGKFMDTIDTNIILDKKVNSQLTTQFEKLDKCRVGYITELTDSDKLNESIIKKITGGDAIDVRGLYKTNTTVNPTANLITLTNELASFKAEKAIIDRLIIIPFKNTFEVDTSFETTMMQKLDLLFSYVMKHGIICDKFDIPEEMMVAKQDYVDDNAVSDPLSDFIAEKIIIGEEGEKPILNREFFTQFQYWLQENNIKSPLTLNKIGRCMKKYGIVVKESNSKSTYRNCRWRPEEAESE